MIKIETTIDRDIDVICKEHYARLLPILEKRLKRKGLLSARQKAFIEPNLKKIITAKPIELESLFTRYRKFCAGNRHGKGKCKWDRNLHKFFHYKQFSKDEKYNAYHLMVNLNTRVCSYCNRQYTFTVVNSTKNILRPDFDHFLPQSKYPLFSLSFYNLVPSCNNCNSRLKGISEVLKAKQNIHPYHEGFSNDASFNYEPLDYKSAIGLGENMSLYFEYKGSPDKIKRTKKNVKQFKLEDVYQQHSDIVSEIVRKHYITNGTYLIELKKAFPKLGTLEELYRIAFGNYYHYKEHEKRVLSKLTRDIVNKLNFDLPEF